MQIYNRWVSVVALIIVGILGGCYGRQQGQGLTNNPNYRALAEEIDTYFVALQQLGQFHGVVWVEVGGEEVVTKAYNLAEVIDAGGEVEVGSQFVIASVSKLWVKHAIYRLEAEGKLGVTDSLGVYFRGFDGGSTIQIQHLLDHSSGLPRELKEGESARLFPEDTVLALAKAERLLFEPGTDTLYSNVGYQLLRSIIGKVSGKGYMAHLREEMIEPMGLRYTGEYNDRKTNRANFAYGIKKDDEGNCIRIDSLHIYQYELGNIISNVKELARFGEWLGEDSVGKRMLDEEGIVSHAGGRSGYRAYFYQDEQQDIRFIFLCNYNRIPFKKIIDAVPAMIRGEAYEFPEAVNRKAISIRPELLEEYVGQFSLDVSSNTVFETYVEGDSLYLRDNSGEETVLFAESDTVFFFAHDDPESVVFVYDSGTNQYEMVVLIEGGMRLSTSRVD